MCAKNNNSLDSCEDLTVASLLLQLTNAMTTPESNLNLVVGNMPNMPYNDT